MTNRKRQGLGLGLGALMPTDRPAEQPGLLVLPIDSIAPNPQQPRRTFNQEQLDDLSASIREHGILQPLVVSAVGNGRYHLIAGERRWRASQQAGLTEVPALVKEIAGDQSLVLALVENIQRADLSPLEEARAYEALQKEYGLTHQEISERVGKSRATVTNALRLLNLPRQIQEQLEADAVTAGHLRAVATLPEHTATLAVQQIIDHGLTVREAEELARLVQQQHITPAQARETIRQRGAQPRNRSAAPSVSPEAAPQLSVEDAAVEDQLRRALSTKVELRRSGKGGRLTIWFHDDEQLEDVLRLLGIDD